MNLLQETQDFLHANGKNVEDVKWVGSPTDTWFSWDVFANNSFHTDYDEISDKQKVAWDLVVVGNDWWLARAIIDGKECWEFLTLPTQPKEEGELKNFLK